MKPGNQNSYKSLKSISIDDKNYKYYSLAEAEKNGLKLQSTEEMPANNFSIIFKKSA